MHSEAGNRDRDAGIIQRRRQADRGPGDGIFLAAVLQNRRRARGRQAGAEDDEKAARRNAVVRVVRQKIAVVVQHGGDRRETRIVAVRGNCRQGGASDQNQCENGSGNTVEQIGNEWRRRVTTVHGGTRHFWLHSYEPP